MITVWGCFILWFNFTFYIGILILKCFLHKLKIPKKLKTVMLGACLFVYQLCFLSFHEFILFLFHLILLPLLWMWFISYLYYELFHFVIYNIRPCSLCFYTSCVFHSRIVSHSYCLCLAVSHFPVKWNKYFYLFSDTFKLFLVMLFQ